MKPANKSIQNPLHHNRRCNNDLVALHIATSTDSLKKGFPPPIHHRLIGFATITISSKKEGKEGGGWEVELLTQADLEGEKHLLASLINCTKGGGGREVVNFLPFNFTLPVLRGSAYRTGEKFSDEKEAWYDVSAWFGGLCLINPCCLFNVSPA